MSKLRSSREFQRLLSGFDLEDLESHAHSVFGLTHELTLGYFNPAWLRFAEENGGEDVERQWRLGCEVLAAADEAIRPFFARHYRDCLTGRQTWMHDYECSSPDLYRRFHMHVYPVASGAGLLVVNTLVVEEAHDPTQRPAHAPIEERYLREDGGILQCVHCRRVQRNDGSQAWDWVPAFVQTVPASATGGLCKPCYHAHYPFAPIKG